MKVLTWHRQALHAVGGTELIEDRLQPVWDTGQGRAQYVSMRDKAAHDKAAHDKAAQGSA